MSDDDIDWDAIRICDDGPIEPEPAGRVDITARLADGSTWRVATVGAEVVLTIAGADGMTSIRLNPEDSDLLGSGLNAGEMDARRIRRGDR